MDSSWGECKIFYLNEYPMLTLFGPLLQLCVHACLMSGRQGRLGVHSWRRAVNKELWRNKHLDFFILTQRKNIQSSNFGPAVLGALLLVITSARGTKDFMVLRPFEPATDFFVSSDGNRCCENFVFFVFAFSDINLRVQCYKQSAA